MPSLWFHIPSQAINKTRLTQNSQVTTQPTNQTPKPNKTKQAKTKQNKQNNKTKAPQKQQFSQQIKTQANGFL
jgi:hypothetical protein